MQLICVTKLRLPQRPLCDSDDEGRGETKGEEAQGVATRRGFSCVDTFDGNMYTCVNIHECIEAVWGGCILGRCEERALGERSSGSIEGQEWVDQLVVKCYKKLRRTSN